MNAKLPPSASVAHDAGGVKLFAPAADRNAAILTEFLQNQAPRQGRALEIASGTGQHIAAFATALPGLCWHPSDVENARLASIDAYAADVAGAKIAPARHLDATKAGWHRQFDPFDLVLLVNLLHLVPIAAARTLIHEAALALNPGGVLILYGPFKRHGVLTSDGDARFDADLRGADPMIGYKDDQDMHQWGRQAGCATVDQTEMPANNLAFVARKPCP